MTEGKEQSAAFYKGLEYHLQLMGWEFEEGCWLKYYPARQDVPEHLRSHCNLIAIQHEDAWLKDILRARDLFYEEAGVQ